MLQGQIRERRFARSTLAMSDERQVQDKKSHHYEEIRYRTPWSRRYHARPFAKLSDRARPAGRVLDVGCGPGLLSEFMP